MKSKKTRILIGVILIVFLFIVQPENYLLLYLSNRFHSTLNILIQIITWAELLILYFYAVKIEKQQFLLWDESRCSVKFYLLSTLFILLVTLLGGIFIYYLRYLFGRYNFYNKLHIGIPAHIFVLMLRVITAAVVEEFIFRGYLMPRLQLFFKNNYLIIFISATTFGLAHLSGGNIANTVFPLFVGLIFGYYYWKYKNIKTLIICHFITDLIFVLL